MNTLYILPNTKKECSADSLAPKPICPGESARQGNFLLYNLYNLYNVLRVPNVLKTVCFHTLYLRQSKPSYNFPILIPLFSYLSLHAFKSYAYIVCIYTQIHIIYLFISTNSFLDGFGNAINYFQQGSGQSAPTNPCPISSYVYEPIGQGKLDALYPRNLGHF